jgi:hypothetical protein
MFEIQARPHDLRNESIHRRRRHMVLIVERFWTGIFLWPLQTSGTTQGSLIRAPPNRGSLLVTTPSYR